MKNRLISLFLVVFLLFPLCVLGESPVYSTTITSFSKDDGSAVLNLKIKDPEMAAWAYGDLFSVSLPDGSVVLVPYMQKLSDVSDASFCLYAPKTNVRLAYRGDKISSLLSLKKGDTVTLSLIAPGYYRQNWVMGQLEAVDKRKNSESDAAYANFRMVSGGNLLPGLLYRGTHPINGEDRAAYMQKLIAEAGIASIVNLSDTPETLAELEAEGLYEQLLAQGKVFCAGMDDTDLSSPLFQQQLAATLTYLAYADSPCLIHCIYGKDRTGMVCAILQALCGASYEEILADYLFSYINWYRLTPEDEAYGYAVSILRDWLCQALNLSAPESSGLTLPARAYLLSCGMTESVLDDLILHLTGMPAATPVPSPTPSPTPSAAFPSTPVPTPDTDLFVFH